MARNKENTLKIPKLGKVISKIQNPSNISKLHTSAYQMFTRPKHTQQMIHRLKHEKTVRTPYDEKTMDAHDGKVIDNYVKGVKKYVSRPNPLHLTPRKYNLDVFTRFNGEKLIANNKSQNHALSKSAFLRQQYINNKVRANEDPVDNPPTLAEQAHKALIDNKKLDQKYGYKFTDKPRKLGKGLKKAILNRNKLIAKHQTKISKEEETYFNKHISKETDSERQNHENDDISGASTGFSIKPMKSFATMNKAKDYANSINQAYDSSYKARVEYNHQHPSSKFNTSPKELRNEKNNKRKFNRNIKNTYARTRKIAKRLDKKYNHPTKAYQNQIAQYNQAINNELIKQGYLSPTHNGKNMLKDVVGLHHPVKNKKYKKYKHDTGINKKQKQTHDKKLTKQQMRYMKNQGQQFK